ncbi:MAG: TetR/AcrR family transcriptional regulator [Proteobacteria bacterium]|nr:TetR/AcrR family transcriptional regulator [Pseudomonadota bacterium]
MKAKILSAARNLFAEYGYHGVTTRMIAKKVDIDISTLHYHWGDKEDLYQSVLTDVNDEIAQKLSEIEKMVRGKSLTTRLEVAIEVMCDYLFANPEAAKLIVLGYFSKTRPGDIRDGSMAEHVSNIAYAMGLAPDRKDVSVQANARVLAVSNAIFSFTSGESLFRPLLNVKHKEYVAVVKENLKFILIPAFTKKG